MGHIPVLMTAATSAACIIPLALAKPGIGYALSGIAFLTLATVTLQGLRKATVAPAPAARTTVPAGALAR
jgi:hypothetical protein